MQNDLATDVILQSLSDSFKPFILNFNMNEIDKIFPQLLGIQIVCEAKGKRNKNAKLRVMERNCPVYLDAVKKAKAVGVSTFGIYRRISKLHKDVLLDPFVFEQIDVCESLLLGKMNKAPFSGKCEQASDLLGLIQSDVCGPMNTQARGGFQYFITFTDDFSRYVYIYLMRHKSEVLEKFKEFKNEVHNQHGKKYQGTSIRLMRIILKPRLR
ncbi:hypothetical protein GQ457_16G017340 [Hibiscus cannabinus]